MPTQNMWNNQVADAAVTFNGGVTSIGTDAASNAINIGTGAAAKTVTVGNVTGATAVNINTGTGGTAITTTNGTIGLISGTGAVNVGADAAAKTVTVGNTTGASVLALKYGTGDFTLASATGTVMSALDTGEITYPLQSAFLAVAAAQSNVTGDGTNYDIAFSSEIFDQNGDFSTANGWFVAPVTGKYFFYVITGLEGILSTHTNMANNLNTSNRSYFCLACSPYAIIPPGANIYTNSSFFADMDAGDLALSRVTVFNGTKVIDITATVTKFGGYLAC